MCLYPFGMDAKMKSSDIPTILLLDIVRELAEMVCATQKEGKSCLERVRPYGECCIVCRSKTVLDLPEIQKHDR